MEEVKDLKEILGPHSIEIKKDGGPLSDRLKRVKDLPSVEADACIYRVHDGLRTAETEAHYKPLLVSIGPYHHGDKKLRALMQEHKLRYLNSFLERTGKRLEDCMSIVEGCADSALACYAGPIKMTCNEFVEMMLLDSCFIIEFLYRLAGKDGTANDARKSDPILKVDWMGAQVVRDFHLLENQVPFGPPLRNLYETPCNGDLLEAAKGILPDRINFQLPARQRQRNHFLDPVKKFMVKILKYCFPRARGDPQNDDVEGQQRETCHVEYKHFLDLVTKTCVPSKKEEEKKKQEEKPKKQDDGEEKTSSTHEMPCVTELWEGSIAFEVNKSDKATLFDIEFHSKYRWLRQARLKFPCLRVDDHTETYFRNLIAYEQHNPDAKVRYFTDYTHFLDELVTTEKDVRYLRLHGIIDNMLGDDKEVVTLINRLGHGVIIDPNTYYYSQVCQQVNAHYEKPWNKSMARLRAKYFHNPWACVSTIAGILFLLLTATSTVVSLFKYFA